MIIAAFEKAFKSLCWPFLERDCWMLMPYDDYWFEGFRDNISVEELNVVNNIFIDDFNV